MSKANERQVSGNHYKDRAKKTGTQQHWDRMWDLYREAWFVGNITKYVERYRDKNGLDDLEKARHYLDKLIEKEVEALAKEEDDAPTLPVHKPHPSHKMTLTGRSCEACGVPRQSGHIEDPCVEAKEVCSHKWDVITGDDGTLYDICKLCLEERER